MVLFIYSLRAAAVPCAGLLKGALEETRRSLTAHKVLWIPLPPRCPIAIMAKPFQGGYNITNDGDNASMMRGGVLASTAGC